MINTEHLDKIILTLFQLKLLSTEKNQQTKKKQLTKKVAQSGQFLPNGQNFINKLMFFKSEKKVNTY